MEQTQQQIEAWTDSIHNVWQSQGGASGGEWYSGWSCILVVLAFMFFIGYQHWLDYKEKMAEIHNSEEYKRNKAAHEASQKGQLQEGEVSEG